MQKSGISKAKLAEEERKDVRCRFRLYQRVKGPWRNTQGRGIGKLQPSEGREVGLSGPDKPR